MIHALVVALFLQLFLCYCHNNDYGAILVIRCVVLVNAVLSVSFRSCVTRTG